MWCVQIWWTVQVACYKIRSSSPSKTRVARNSRVTSTRVGGISPYLLSTLHIMGKDLGAVYCAMAELE